MLAGVAPAADCSSISNSTSPADRRRSSCARTTLKRSALVTITGVMRLRALRATLVEIEAQQHIAGAHPVALAHQHLETLAAERHGVDADVHEDFRAAGGTQCNGVARGGDRNHLAIAGRAQLVADRIDGHALAQHGAREHFIRNFRERSAPSREWRAN